MFKVESVGACPKPLGWYDLRRAGEYLSNAGIVVDGRFDARGIATLLGNRPRYSNNAYRCQMWGGQDLLRYDPETERLRLTRGGALEVYQGMDRDRKTICTIDPCNTRSIVGVKTGRVPVLEGGFILPPPDAEGLYQSPIKHRRIPTEEFLELVREAERGRVFTEVDWLNDKLVIPRVSLSKGTMIEIIMLNGWRDVYSDQVIIDPETRQLVDRQMVYPFARAA